LQESCTAYKQNQGYREDSSPQTEPATKDPLDDYPAWDSSYSRPHGPVGKGQDEHERGGTINSQLHIMVQKSEDAIITRIVLVRVVLFVMVLVVGFYLGTPFESFLTNTLGYKESCTGFFCLNGIETGILALTLSYSLWMGIIFGAAGKKADYILIGIYFFLVALLFSQESGVTWQMYLGLLGVTAVGNLFGYAIKMARLEIQKKNKTI
jgi:hypothetical protein